MLESRPESPRSPRSGKGQDQESKEKKKKHNKEKEKEKENSSNDGEIEEGDAAKKGSKRKGLLGVKIKKLSKPSSSVRTTSPSFILRTAPDFPYVNRKNHAHEEEREAATRLSSHRATYTLPDEIWMSIFRFIVGDKTEPRAAVASMLVCQHWRAMFVDIIYKTPLGLQWILSAEDFRLAKYRKRSDYQKQVSLPKDGGTYIGEWILKYGRHGRGEFVSKKSDTYIGCWFFDKQHGWGISGTRKKDRYEGFFANGKKHGRGKEIDREGHIYEGTFINNLKYGRGIFTYPDGTVYDGEWVDGKKSGKGTQRYDNGSYYEGDWAAGKKHGQGVFVYISGSRYEGGWVDGKEEGWGVLIRSNGEKYEGEWKGGKRHGKGVLTNSHQVLKGRWSKGKFVKKEEKEDFLQSF